MGKQSMCRRNKMFLILVPIIILVVLLEFHLLTPVRGTFTGLYNRTFKTPDIVKNHDYVNLNYTKFPNREKEKFYLAYKEKKGFYGLVKKQFHVCGTAHDVYLVTEDGKLTRIHDCTRDHNGGRGFVIEHPSDIVLGSYDEEWNFTEKPEGEEHKDIFLQVPDNDGR
jgi:hypothetical protein